MASAASASVASGHLLPADANDIVAAAQGGATQAVLAATKIAAAASGAARSGASSATASTSARTDRGPSGQAASAVTGQGGSGHGWFANTGRNLLLALLIAGLLVLNGRVVLTIAHGRRRGGPR
jgi:hypothetical protein